MQRIASGAAANARCRASEADVGDHRRLENAGAGVGICDVGVCSAGWRRDGRGCTKVGVGEVGGARSGAGLPLSA